MKTQVFQYLKSYSTQPFEVDKLIVSAFFKLNHINVFNNNFLKSYIITEINAEEFNKLIEFTTVIEKQVESFNIEQLIELFEFVISPSDRIINGAVYTPLKIRDFIITSSFKTKKDSLSTSKIADISCGCGGFLFNAAKQLKSLTHKTYYEIFARQIFGLDIQAFSITRTKLLLSILAVSEGEDRDEFHFNLHKSDALTFQWKQSIENFTGFDIIIGNPPYVRAKNLSDESKANLENWDVSKSGNTDLYIPFFQIGIENLSEKGILGFITMNSFFKSLNGRALRDYFQKRSIKLLIIDFGNEQVFKSKNTYTCICLIEQSTKNYIKYYRCESTKLPDEAKEFNKIMYSGLNSKTGWNLHENVIISKIESTGVSFGSLYATRHGIATLKNDIYIFDPVKEDEDYYYLQNGSLYQIEKGICRDIVNSNKLSRPVTFKNLKEKVIFPYDNSNKPKILEEDFIEYNYPMAYNYLQSKRNSLAQRDKGKGDYEKWFAFGRTQSLEKIKNKMFFPKYSDRTPSLLINDDENVLFYNGLAVVGHSKEDMIVIKKIMETRLFWYYIKSTSKPYSSNYYSLNGNYIKNFGICDLNNRERAFVIDEQESEVLNRFFEKKYDIQF